MRGADRLAEPVVRILPAVHSDYAGADRGAGLEHRPAPLDRGDPSALADRGTDRISEVEDLPVALARREIRGRRVAIDQPVASGLDPGEGRGTNMLDALAQISRPVERRDPVQRLHDIVERVGGDALVARIDPEEGAREIVDRAL